MSIRRQIQAGFVSFPEQYHVPYLKVVPESEESVYTEWSSPVFSAVSAYVLEWKTEEGTSFEVVDKNQSSMVISGTTSEENNSNQHCSITLH